VKLSHGSVSAQGSHLTGTAHSTFQSNTQLTRRNTDVIQEPSRACRCHKTSTVSSTHGHGHTSQNTSLLHIASVRPGTPFPACCAAVSCRRRHREGTSARLQATRWESRNTSSSMRRPRPTMLCSVSTQDCRFQHASISCADPSPWRLACGWTKCIRVLNPFSMPSGAAPMSKEAHARTHLL